MKAGIPLLNEVRKTSPIVHCITNIVVANFQANGLLSLGASPIMAASIEEAADVSAFSAATLLNIGTLDSKVIGSMIAAGQSANANGHPLVLDPVGAGATTFRKQTVSTLLNELDVTLIRGNAGEIAAIAGVAWNAKGVDAGEGTANIQWAAKDVAVRHRCLVAVTGETDLVTDGEKVLQITGGHPLMSKITGMGCLLSAVAAAFLAVGKNDKLEAVAYSLAFYKKAGEWAAERTEGPGDFEVHFLNALHLLTDKDLNHASLFIQEEVF
ncbi:hydroxyethylthiazole kinase [Sporosarcina oncorhynchi]|uniref:Hydroxyethylthiazole kinase n=1 Tax=Sporosarcina oncorhynchi TaxID=3056444 RepID=A0ABZ0L5E1_9BACL|nr:hydroxyethylthiazole kinase [Sporosarcina sp. T2O-4]WOV86801.1 hydroxyethylthiazole kinase [Sporosarcina sp. T2O-4]